MKKSEAMLSISLTDIMDAPLVGSWKYICDKHGINPYCLNEGLANGNDKIKISVEDAEYIGILED